MTTPLSVGGITVLPFGDAHFNIYEALDEVALLWGPVGSMAIVTNANDTNVTVRYGQRRLASLGANEQCAVIRMESGWEIIPPKPS